MLTDAEEQLFHICVLLSTQTEEQKEQGRPGNEAMLIDAAGSSWIQSFTIALIHEAKDHSH